MEDEINYATVKFKGNKSPQPQAQQREEVVYDNVKVLNETTITPKDDSSRPLTETKAERKQFQQLCCCFGTLCIVSLLVVIGLCVHLQKKANELKQLKANQTTLLEENHNLTNLNENLTSDYQRVSAQLHKVTQASAVLESVNRNLTVEGENLERQNQQLQMEKNNLTEQIQNMEKIQNELNVSRAQWSIDAYCPKRPYRRTCESCEKNWKHFLSSCYAFSDDEPTRTWEEARDDCRGKSSDLTVVNNEQEKQYVIRYSWNGCWIGLRVIDGKWQWIDGRILINTKGTKQFPAIEGRCVSSSYVRGLESVSCDEKKAWICEKKALTL